jgi:hypothetical protein
MVCASTEKAAKFAGGFVLVSVAALMTAWRACRIRPLGTGDFRAWLACHELEARRCVLDQGRAPAHSYTELAKLLGVTAKRARASVKRLEVAGLITWSDSAIGFPDQILKDEDLDDTIGRGQGSIAIPRRMLRFLVAGTRPALIATVLGILLRCLSRRRSRWDGRGRVKASWIARVFEVSIPAVKVARRDLVALGWIEPEESSQWSMNRFGRVYRIDLGWTNLATSPLTPTQTDGEGVGIMPTPPRPDRSEGGSTSIPPRPDPGSQSIPPDLQTRNPSGRVKNQEPPGGTGFQSEGKGNEEQSLPSPTLGDVRIEDLKNTGRLLDLHRQAVDRQLVTASEADRLRFVGAAEHALAIAQSPPALFAWIVLNGCWRYITASAEDCARRRLRLDDFGAPRGSAQPTAFSSSRPIEPGGLSDDARIVREVRAAMIRAGLYRDPFPAFQARYPGWDRGRWDAALVELGLRSHAPPESE